MARVKSNPRRSRGGGGGGGGGASSPSSLHPGVTSAASETRNRRAPRKPHRWNPGTRALRKFDISRKPANLLFLGFLLHAWQQRTTWCICLRTPTYVQFMPSVSPSCQRICSWQDAFEVSWTELHDPSIIFIGFLVK